MTFGPACTITIARRAASSLLLAPSLESARDAPRGTKRAATTSVESTMLRTHAF
jgi:hypothetical protein